MENTNKWTKCAVGMYSQRDILSYWWHSHLHTLQWNWYNKHGPSAVVDTKWFLQLQLENWVQKTSSAYLKFPMQSTSWPLTTHTDNTKLIESSPCESVYTRHKNYVCCWRRRLRWRQRQWQRHRRQRRSWMSFHFGAKIECDSEMNKCRHILFELYQLHVSAQKYMPIWYVANEWQSQHRSCRYIIWSRMWHVLVYTWTFKHCTLYIVHEEWELNHFSFRIFATLKMWWIQVLNCF